MSDREVYDRQRKRIAELEEAVLMADNRLEAALMGDTVCRGCVEIAKSYLFRHVRGD
jgi:hypothetical protein